ncbi:hypothetical protein ACIOHB_31530 [Streptomyces microflavus]|uniref:hypothetical protein n=1 Tax=Streptomyces microflavus TaxID=1919 RepID=UPI0038276B18
MTRSRIERVRAAAGIAALALQQIHDDVSADGVDQGELAAMLRELVQGADPPDGLLPFFGQLLTVAARRAEQIEPDCDGGAAFPLYEAADLIADAGQRLTQVARILHP